MQQKELALCLKVVDAIVVVSCVWFILYYLPHGGFNHMGGTLPFAPVEVWPVRTMALAVVAAVPVVVIGISCWQVFTCIGRDESFTLENARRLRRVSITAIAEAVIFIIAAAICSFVQVLVPALFILLFICLIVSLAISIVAAALSHLTLKAAVLKDENDLTV